VDSDQIVIVALPSEYDDVRKTSSEKEPHLTLLYLGSPGYNADQIGHITDYVEHASNMLKRFHLDVTKRGILGKDEADVLFFNKKWSKEIELFREHLLQDPLIFSAYQSADQFDDWVPHLTMGYPRNPAKDVKDRHRFYGVSFDKVALWTADSSGPTFSLDEPSYDSEVAMGELRHYGVKGMKWGVRRSDAELARSRPASGESPRVRLSEDARRTRDLHRKIQTKGTGTLSNQEMRQYLERMDLERRYSQLAGTNRSDSDKSALDRGHEQVKKYLAYGNTYENVRKFIESPTGQAVKTGVQSAVAAGFAYFTGGAGPAAAAGASVIVRRATQ